MTGYFLYGARFPISFLLYLLKSHKLERIKSQNNAQDFLIMYNTCDVCKSLDGKEFDFYDEVPERPHPNCRCTVEIVEDTRSNNVSETATKENDDANKMPPHKQGQVIAKSGNAGTSSGPHLHITIREGNFQGKAVDPGKYIKIDF